MARCVDNEHSAEHATDIISKAAATAARANVVAHASLHLIVYTVDTVLCRWRSKQELRKETGSNKAHISFRCVLGLFMLTL